MKEDLSKLVNKEFQRLLPGLDIKQIHAVFDANENVNVLRRFSSNKSPDAKKVFHNICDIVVGAMEQYISKHGAIIKAEINYSIADYFNKQLGEDTYAHYIIRDSIVHSPYFQNLLKDKRIMKAKIRDIAKMSDDSALSTLEKRSIFYKTEKEAIEYLRQKSHHLGYKMKEERINKKRVHSDNESERLKGMEYLRARIAQHSENIKSQDHRYDDICTYAQILTIFHNAEINENKANNIVQSPLKNLLIIQEDPNEPFSISKTVAFTEAYAKDKKFRNIAQQYIK
jgi:hypothetical protein